MSVTTPPAPTRDYNPVPNDWSRDPGLTWAEKGMLAYLTGHAASHALTMEQIIAEGEDGADAARSILRRLEAKGWLKRTPVRGYRGRISRYDYAITVPGPVVDLTGSGPTACRPTASGQAATSDDLGKLDVSAVGTASGQTAPGKPGTKKTTPKKTKNTISADDTSPAAMNTQQILGGFIDWLRLEQQGGVELPGRIRGQYARNIKGLLDEGYPVDLVKRALARAHERGLVGSPSLLASLAVEVQHQPKREAPKSFAQQAQEKRDEQARHDAAVDALMEQRPDLNVREAIALVDAEIAKRHDSRTSGAYIEGEALTTGTAAPEVTA